MKNKVQQFGKFLSGMVMPNIGALIAFGFLAALFIDTGWIPNEKMYSFKRSVAQRRNCGAMEDLMR